MKIIVSHDVDHLYAWDHPFKDLILEKMWVRSFIHLLQRKISFKTFLHRLTFLFHNKMHHIEDVVAFDKAHSIPSVFFFGMDNILGMSYSQKNAQKYIKYVHDHGLDVGVHGVDYKDTEKMRREWENFKNLSGITEFGTRTHYVRFDDNTFEKMNKVGYLFDSSWFNKKKVELRGPYKIGNMWEFPLHIMDGYVCKPGYLQQGLEKTKKIIKKAEKMKLPYCTILFHDYQYDEVYDPEMKEWYEKTIEFCIDEGYEFISYRDAMKELEVSGTAK